MQFPEHENGAKSGHSKVVKLDKLAKLLDVLIHIDGIPYGANRKPVANVEKTEDVAAPKTEKPTVVQDEVVKPVAKKPGRKPSTKKQS